MKISAIITLKKDVLDPQGKVIHQTLDGMNFKDVNEVRQGKYFEIDVSFVTLTALTFDCSCKIPSLFATSV